MINSFNKFLVDVHYPHLGLMFLQPSCLLSDLWYYPNNHSQQPSLIEGWLPMPMHLEKYHLMQLESFISASFGKCKTISLRSHSWFGVSSRKFPSNNLFCSAIDWLTDWLGSLRIKLAPAGTEKCLISSVLLTRRVNKDKDKAVSLINNFYHQISVVFDDLKNWLRSGVLDLPGLIVLTDRLEVVRPFSD